MSAASSPASFWPSFCAHGYAPTRTQATADTPSGGRTAPLRLARVLPNATVLHAEEVVGHRDGRLAMTLLDVMPQPAQQLRLLAGGDQRPALRDPHHRHVLQHLLQPGPDLGEQHQGRTIGPRI